MGKLIAVIGAGASGLTAIKCCLDEDLTPICFENSDDIGGLWRYCDFSTPNMGNIYSSCVINTSKEMTAYSDFPVPRTFPSFMPHAVFLRYLRMYADKFQLLKYIRYKSHVERIFATDDYDATGRWNVVVRVDGDAATHVVDGVMVCTGHHVYPHIPHLPGVEHFKGSVIHSHAYKKPHDLQGKNVLIMGIGDSAVDIAVDISHVTTPVHISTRRGAWVVSRMGPFGIPLDVVANSRLAFSLPKTLMQWIVEVIANFRFDHKHYGLHPKHGVLDVYPTINDELPYRIMVGAIKIVADIDRLTKTGAILTDGSELQVDVIIMATGYNYQYDFLDDSVMPVHDNRVCLYKYVFPPRLLHPTLAIIGLVQPVGSVIPISEIQARWYTRVVKGLLNLPNEASMLADVEKKQERAQSNYPSSQRHALQTQWIEYMDEIAEQLNVRPNLLQLFIREPMLALRCYFGPCIPAQYRLSGPGQWPGARKAIRRALKNNICSKEPAKERMSNTENSSTKMLTLTRVLAVLILPIVLLWVIMSYCDI